MFLFLAQTELEFLDLSSTSGIVIATLFLLEILKRIFRNLSFFNKIPVFIYGIVISAILTIVANRILKTSNNEPILQGANIWLLIWRSGIAAMAASGFYSWLRNPINVEKAGTLGSNSDKPMKNPNDSF